MDITYKWIIEDIVAKIQEGELSNIAETVHWRYKAIDNLSGLTFDTYGSIKLDSPNPESFIESYNLKKADVESWLESKLNVANMQSALKNKIHAHQNPTHVSITIN